MPRPGHPWVFMDYSELPVLRRRGTCVESSGQINSRMRWQRKHIQVPGRAGGKSALKMSRRHVFSSQLLRSFNSWVQKRELPISWLCPKFQVKGEVKTMIRRFPLLLVPHFQQDKVSQRTEHGLGSHPSPWPHCSSPSLKHNQESRTENHVL